jgi:hypothetical protein
MTWHLLPAGQQQQYILTADGLLEVNRVKHAATSWLVGDSFISGAQQQLHWHVGISAVPPSATAYSLRRLHM